MFTPPSGATEDRCALAMRSARPAGASHASRAQPQRKREEEPARASRHVCARASRPVRVASCHRYTIVAARPEARKYPPSPSKYAVAAVSPFWIWTQIAIVVFVLIGMIIAITKLA